MPLDPTSNKLHVVQKTYVGKNYVYALELINKDKDAYLVRADKPTSGYTVDFENGAHKMLLSGFGHGQTLEYFSYNNKDYWWIVTKAGDNQTYHWGTQIGRIQYVDNTSIDSYTQVTRLSSLNRANKNGTSFGTLLRVDAALNTDDTNGRKLLIFTESDDSPHKGQFAYYDNQKLNQALDVAASGSNYISCGSDEVLKAVIDSYEIDDVLHYMPNGSIQGLEFSNGQAIYVSGNQGPSNSSGTITLGTVPKIGKALWGKVPNNLTLYNTNWPNGYIEIEGLQLTGDYIYFGLSYHDESSLETTENRIYRVDKSYWD